MRDILRRLLGWKAVVPAPPIPVITEHLDIQYYVAPTRRGIFATEYHGVFIPDGQRRLYEARWRDGR